MQSKQLPFMIIVKSMLRVYRGASENSKQDTTSTGALGMQGLLDRQTVWRKQLHKRTMQSINNFIYHDQDVRNGWNATGNS